MQAAREPVLPASDWPAVLAFLGALVIFSLATGAFATWAFRAYQRSL